jgi:hypothetical protein
MALDGRPPQVSQEQKLNGKIYSPWADGEFLFLSFAPLPHSGRSDSPNM